MRLVKGIGVFLFVLSLFLFPNSTPGQRLPRGKYHTVRDRQIDILHYRVQLGIDFDNRIVSATATIRFTPLSSLQEFSLNAIQLRCNRVKWSQSGGTKEIAFSQTERELHVSFPTVLTPSETLTIMVDYTAQPTAGMYFLRDYAHPGQFFVYTYGEGGLLANWLPIYNDVNDKFSSEMIITVPPPYIAISNGKLLATHGDSRGNHIFHWKQTLPHSNYLMALYVGEFEQGELRPAFGSIPMHFWVPRGHLQEGERVFRNTPKMVEFFSNRFQYRYPWDKYDQIAIPDFAIGAMEHTGITGHRASVLRGENAPVNFGPPDFERYFTVWSYENIISHELAHHWFGDNLTCRSLNQIWLNESFATYCQMLYDEYALGKDAFHFIRQEALDRYFNYVHTHHLIRPLEYARYDAVSQMYTTEITYFKGALILHMLRNTLGDEDFFRTLSYYLHKHEFSNVGSNDLKIAIEEVTGKNLDWFFSDWIYGGGFPIFEVDYTYLPWKKGIVLQVKQVQPIVAGQDLFNLPVTVAVYTSSGVEKKKIQVQNENEDFFLPCSGSPLLVSFDGEGALVAEIRFPKSLKELLYQSRHDELPGQIRALRQMVLRYPGDPRTGARLSELIAGAEFWGLRAESARLSGEVRTPAAEKTVAQALRSSDYRIRKAAVLALPKFPLTFARKTLKAVIRNDPHHDVVATAIVMLAKTDPEINGSFIRTQLGRSSWYDEIRLACLNAFAMIGNKELIPDIKPFTRDNHHEFMQLAALKAWRSCNPEDPELHQVLLRLAEKGKYTVQKGAIEMLGELRLEPAIPILEKIRARSGDQDFRVAAAEALEKIQTLSRRKDKTTR